MTDERKERIGELGRVILGILLVSAAAITLATFPGLIQVLPRPKRRRKLQPWDGWWRIVTFDIPQRKKYLREIFRTKLRALGFYPLQKSVFVHPSACEREIVSLTEFFEAHPYIHVIRAQHIDPEEKVRQYFEV